MPGQDGVGGDPAARRSRRRSSSPSRSARPSRRVGDLAGQARLARRRSRSRRSARSPARASRGRQACTTRKAPVRFTSMSRCHCSAVIRWAGAIVSVIAAFETQTSISPRSGSSSRGEVELWSQPSSRSSVDDLEAVGAQPLGDRRADPARGAGDERAAPHSSVSCVAGAAGVGLLVEALEQRLRLLGVGAGVGVPGLGPQLVVERLADHVEDRLLRRAHGAPGELRRICRATSSASSISSLVRHDLGRPGCTAARAGRRSARR